MKIELMVDRFNSFENKYELFDMNIEGFSVWPYIRFEMYFAIGNFFHITNGVGSTPKSKFKDVALMLWNTFIANPSRTIKGHDVLIIPHQRRVLEGKEYKCIYTDELATELPYSCVSAEFLFGRIHFRPAKTKNLVYLDGVDVWPAIKYKLTRKKIDRFRPFASTLSESIKEFFHVEVDTEYISGLICKKYYWHRYKKPIVQKFLNRVKPRVIIELVGYETNKMIINEVAQELSIPCIELQHGVIGRGHIAYNYQLNQKLKQMPTHLFVYSSYWKETCSFPIERDAIIPTGFPYMEEQIEKYLPKVGNKEIRIIIFSSTDHTEFIRDFAEEIIRIMDHLKLEYEIIYKLHPLEYNYDSSTWSRIKASKNVRFINNSNHSFHYLNYFLFFHYLLMI